MGKSYCTQMEAARKEIVTPELRKVAEKEQRTEQELMKLVAEVVGLDGAERSLDGAIYFIDPVDPAPDVDLLFAVR